VALGRDGAGPKLQAGDNRVPEGVYRIVGRNPHSAFHRALRVGYSTPEQVRKAQARGVDPGGNIMVHAIRNGLGLDQGLYRRYRRRDRRNRCLVPDGTPTKLIARTAPRELREKTRFSVTSPSDRLAPTIFSYFFVYLEWTECVDAFGIPPTLGQ
jgi:hypothetical protein